MTPADTVAIALVSLIGLVLVSGVFLVFLVIRLRRREHRVPSTENITWDQASFPTQHPVAMFSAPRPACWLAIKGRDPRVVQAALALNNPTACSWSDGLTTDRQLFITPPVNGWILVLGNGLLVPGDDVDVCFRFLVALSRKLGHVQFFQADRVLDHHAWARVEAGRVVRAYAWADRTLWNQGAKTVAETALGMKCFAYDETASPVAWGVNDLVAANVDKIPLLAARWSVNPAAIDARFWEQRRGIAGRLSRRY